LDKELIEILAERMQLSATVGVLKKESGTPVLDENREEKLRKMHRSFAKKNKLPIPFTEDLFKSIFIQSRKTQE